MHNLIELERVSPSGRNFFFGYYDKSPWHHEKQRILAAEAFIAGRLPKKQDRLDLGYFEKQGGSWQWYKFAESYTWNFQQANMLQWLDGDRVIFNSLVDGECGSVILDLADSSQTELSRAIYCVSRDKSLALAVNFDLIQAYRPGYGYSYVRAPHVRYDQDGIWRIELGNLREQLILPYSYFIDQGYVNEDERFWIDHLMFSPQDKHIAFLLRNLTADEGVYSRLFVINSDGSSARCLLDTGMASHADWYDENTFSVWGRKAAVVRNIQKSKLASWLRPIVKIVRSVGVPNVVRKNLYGDCFMHININTASAIEFAQTIPANLGGGHFSFAQAGRWMLNDTPIDREGWRELMLYDLATSQRVPLIRLRTPPEINSTGWRCDLHPRWHPDEQQLCIDSIHEGYRGIYIADLAPILSRSTYEICDQQTTVANQF